MALRPRRGTWARAADAHTPVDAARALAWGGPDDPGDWQTVRRTFRDGHAEIWWAADATPGGWGPDGVRRLVVATADPGTLPDKATWYLVTNLPRPAAPASRAARTPPRAWPRSCADAASGTGPSRATSRSKTSWAGPTSRSAPISRSAATRSWSTARSASAGPPGSRIRHRRTPRRRHRRPAAEKGGPGLAGPPPCWPRAIRSVRAWLAPWIALQRWWAAWSNAPPPPQLQALISSVAAGCGLHLYIPN